MTKQQLDDLEAVRSIAETLQPFPDLDRERILRWVRERLGMSAAVQAAPHSRSGEVATVVPSSAASSATEKPGGTRGTRQDVRSFVAEKDPRNDIELSATVAYFYRFEAPEGEQREAITGNDLVEACRAADRPRPSRPAQTLVNAYKAGVLDRGAYGKYRLNSVGENLVAMVLPDHDGESKARRTTGRKRTGPRKKKVVKKKKTAKQKTAKNKATRQ